MSWLQCRNPGGSVVLSAVRNGPGRGSAAAALVFQGRHGHHVTADAPGAGPAAGLVQSVLQPPEQDHFYRCDRPSDLGHLGFHRAGPAKPGVVL